MPRAARRLAQLHEQRRLQLRSTQLSTLRSLRIGLLDPVATGNGFDSLEFIINRGGFGTIENQVFPDLASATTFFQDNVLDYVAMAGGGAMSWTFRFDAHQQRRREWSQRGTS